MNKYQEALDDIMCDSYNCIENNYEDSFRQCYKKQFATLQELINNYNAIQDVYFKNEPPESADLNARKLQELYDFDKKLIKENQKLKAAIEVLFNYFSITDEFGKYELYSSFPDYTEIDKKEYELLEEVKRY